MHKRRPNPRGQGGRLREELLTAASGLLTEGGKDAQLTLRAVARAAGVAAPGVYQQFSDLDELMLALIRRHLAELADAIVAALAPLADQPPARQLRAVGHAYAAWGLDHPVPYSVVFDGKVLRQLTRDQEAALWTALHGVVALRIAKPAFPWPPLREHVDAVLEAAWRPINQADRPGQWPRAL